MSVCGKCSKPIRANAGLTTVSCMECNCQFHARCANLAQDDLKFLIDNDQGWRCDPCSQNRRKSMVLESTASRNITFDDIFKMFSELKTDFNRVEKNLGDSLNLCHEEIADTKSLVNQQKIEMTAWMSKVESLTEENLALRKRVVELEARQDEGDQYSRRNTLEIQGIPFSKNEDVVGIVKTVSRALDYPLEDLQIDACHRLRSKEDSGKPPGIIVKMVRRIDAEGLLQRRRVKRNLSTHDLGMKQSLAQVVYVNESLSPARRRLLAAARQVKKDKAYTYLWIRAGRIFMRKNQGDPVKVLSVMNDLDNL